MGLGQSDINIVMWYNNDKDDQWWSYNPAFEDFIRLANFGYKVSDFIVSSVLGTGENDAVIVEMFKKLDESNLSEDLSKSLDLITEVENLINKIDRDRLKKYQLVSLFYIGSHCFNSNGIFNWAYLHNTIINSDDYENSLKLLEDNKNEIKECFKDALEINSKINEIEIDFFTLKKGVIKDIQNAGKGQRNSIESYKNSFGEYCIEMKNELNRKIEEKKRISDQVVDIVDDTNDKDDTNNKTKWWIALLVVVIIIMGVLLYLK